MSTFTVRRSARIPAALAIVAAIAAGCATGAGAPATTAPAAAPTTAATAEAPTAAVPSVAAPTGTTSCGRYSSGCNATPAPVTGSIVVKEGMTGMGTVLVGPTGMTLYTHSGDTKNTSTCSGGCLQAWPALVVPTGAMAKGGPGVTGTFGTFVRADDGATQVTYKGLPLYYYAGDTKPGDATGDGVGGFKLATP